MLDFTWLQYNYEIEKDKVDLLMSVHLQSWNSSSSMDADS